jgi:hypothetical protein
MKTILGNNFWIIFDTCTRIEYYQDVHNLLCLPSGSILRYNYNKKYFEEISLAFSTKGDYPKDVLLLYGQFTKYEKGSSNDIFRSFKESKQDYFIIPTRIASLKGIQNINEEIYLDIELGNYPSILDSVKVTKIIDSIKNTVPFCNPSKYVLISNCKDEFYYLKSNGSNKDNWATIINKFQDNNNQFHEDSFWRLEGPFNDRGKLIKPSYSYTKEGEFKNNYQHFYTINEGVGFYFQLYNYEPKSNIKSDTYKEKIASRDDIEKYIRKIKIDDAKSPVISFLKQIELRQYFISKIKFQKNYNSDFQTKEGACYFSTNGQIDEWPIGPNFYIYFKSKKRVINIIIGLASILTSVGFAIFSSEIFKTDPTYGIINGLIAASLFILASLLLYNQIKVKP